MNVTSLKIAAPRSAGFRPNPAETIEKGVELGADAVQQDLFAFTAGVSDVKSAPDFAEVGKSRGSTSWQKGAYSVAASLAGTPAAGMGLVQTVESLFEDPIARGFFAVAGGLAGAEQTGQLKEITTGYVKDSAENGVLGVAAAVAGPEGAGEAINAGLSEGKDSKEGSLFALATSLAGGAQELGPTVNIARDFASTPELAGPYAVAVAMAGQDQAASALRMAEDLGENEQEKALFAIVGGLVGAERGPGFIRMSRALSPNQAQVGTMALAAALTGADASKEKETVAAAVALLFEPKA
jgi:hypothetical protein